MSNQVQTVEELSLEDFKEHYLNGEKPVLIRKYTKKWKALEWSLESMKAKSGHNTVFVRRNTSQEAYKVGKQYNIQSMLFSDYIDNMIADNKTSKSSYLAVQNIRKALPELCDDIEVPEYVGKLHGGPYLWIARQGHYEFCHFDPDDNILVVLSGQKKVKLFPANEIDKMYPNPLGSKGRTIQSRVNCDDPDYNQFPKFKNVRCYECTVNAGDMLYFPAFWWHQVTSTELTISVNMFFGNHGDNDFLTKIMNSSQWDGFKHWLLNIIEQNRERAQFAKVLQYLPDSVENFLLKQWHEIPNKKQRDKIVNLILNYCGLDCIPEKTISLTHAPPLKIRGLLWRS